MNLRWRDDPLSLKFLQTGLLILIFSNNMFFFQFRRERTQRTENGQASLNADRITVNKPEISVQKSQLQ